MTSVEKQRLRDRMRILPHPSPALTHGGILEDLLLTPLWKGISSILLYSPLPGEPDPSPLVENSPGRRFLYPRLEGERLGIYTPRPGSLWKRGMFGLREPDPETWTACPVAEIDCAVVPGLAFDHGGGRLGRGKGYYDRLLGNAPFRGIKIGLTWEDRIVPDLPLEPHDVRMDLIVTETRILNPSSGLDTRTKSL